MKKVCLDQDAVFLSGKYKEACGDQKNKIKNIG